MEVLAEQLNNYSKHGIPHLPDTVEDLEEALYNLEEDWRDLMKDANLLPERVQQQQTAIWELIQTELAYIRSLKVVNDWCETQKGCNRLGLMDILVKPMQRLTKYSLLLKAIQKHTEIEEHRQSLELMIRHVDMFVNSVNTTLKQKQDMERLRGVIARIEAYDVVESKDEDLERLVRSYNELDLTCPMPGCCNSQRRHLLLESDLRLKDSNTSKIDVHCFLFTDMLLICKPATRRSEGKV
ncbi:pleckstrin homology domain-containing family G member 5-like [Lycorma delicatula]